QKYRPPQRPAVIRAEDRNDRNPDPGPAQARKTASRHPPIEAVAGHLGTEEPEQDCDGKGAQNHPLPGVTLDSQILREPSEASLPAVERHSRLKRASIPEKLNLSWKSLVSWCEGTQAMATATLAMDFFGAQT